MVVGGGWRRGRETSFKRFVQERSRALSIERRANDERMKAFGDFSPRSGLVSVVSSLLSERGRRGRGAGARTRAGEEPEGFLFTLGGVEREQLNREKVRKRKTKRREGRCTLTLRPFSLLFSPRFFFVIPPRGRESARLVIYNLKIQYKRSRQRRLSFVFKNYSSEEEEKNNSFLSSSLSLSSPAAAPPRPPLPAPARRNPWASSSGRRSRTRPPARPC